jgi:gluconate 2-dehydrogenase alpha chain
MSGLTAVMERDRRLPEVDAVIVGMGWAGGIVAAELSKAGLEVVGLERGPDRSGEGSEFKRKHDELRFRVRGDLMQDVAQESWTFRHDLEERALPFRRLGAFLPGTGVGGSAGHYGGNTTRFQPFEFEIRTQTLERYGPDLIPADCMIQDWGITYDELEPYYDTFEHMAGVGGVAGNLRGQAREGGNPFEGPRMSEFPVLPPKHNEASHLFGEACRQLGLHPFPQPVAILAGPYTNQDGITRGGCSYCGDCSHFTCEVEARADPRVTVLPVARRTGRFTLRADAHVVRVLHDQGKAHGVLYRDQEGALIEQPAGIVILAAYALNNVRLLLLSGIGRGYDPHTGSGVVGKNYAYNVHAAGTAFFAGRRFKSYMATGAGGYAVSDWAADNFDHRDLGFIGGVQIAPANGAAPITSLRVPPGTPSWGLEWKRAIRDWYDRSLPVSALGNVLAYRDNYLDLDPTYRDARGDPLLRMTFDWHQNELSIARYAAARIREILEAMGPDAVAVTCDSGHFDTARYQGTHNTGGAIMGSDPGTSAVDSYLRMWEYDNLFVVGGSAFPEMGTPGPTATICALAYRAADGIVRRWAPKAGSGGRGKLS